jgi:hypothetical protein
MCGRVIQSSGPLGLGIVEGLNVSDSRMGDIRPRHNAAPSQELLVKMTAGRLANGCNG